MRAKLPNKAELGPPNQAQGETGERVEAMYAEVVEALRAGYRPEHGAARGLRRPMTGGWLPGPRGTAGYLSPAP